MSVLYCHQRFLSSLKTNLKSSYQEAKIGFFQKTETILTEMAMKTLLAEKAWHFSIKLPIIPTLSTSPKGR
jgi:hypothetical protein